MGADGANGSVVSAIVKGGAEATSVVGSLLSELLIERRRAAATEQKEASAKKEASEAARSEHELNAAEKLLPVKIRTEKAEAALAEATASSALAKASVEWTKADREKIEALMFSFDALTALAEKVKGASLTPKEKMRILERLEGPVAIISEILTDPDFPVISIKPMDLR